MKRNDKWRNYLQIWIFEVGIGAWLYPKKLNPENEKSKNNQIQYEIEQIMIANAQVQKVEVCNLGHWIMINDHQKYAKSQHVENLYQNNAQWEKP